MIAYANLAAILFNKKAYYRYEEGKATVSMPILPIGLDFTLYSHFRDNIAAILNTSDNKKIAKELKIIPEVFAKHLIMEDKRSNRYVYSPLGILLETAYNAEKPKIYGILPDVYYSSQFTSDEINLGNITCQDLKNKLEVLLKLNYVKKIKFDNEKELNMRAASKIEKEIKKFAINICLILIS